MDALITAGTAIQPTIEAIQSDVLDGAAGHRTTTTALAVEPVAALLEQHPVAVVPSEVLRGGHPLAAAAAQGAVVSAHPLRVHHSVVVHVHLAEALAHHPRGRRLAVAHPQAVALAHRGAAEPDHLARVLRQADLAQPELRLVEEHRALEAPGQAAASSVGEAAAPARVAVVSLVAAHAPAEVASLVAVVVDAGLVDLVALEAADDDRFGLCNRRRLGFDHAA